MVDDGVMRLEKNIRNNSMKSQRGKKDSRKKKKKKTLSDMWEDTKDQTFM